MILRVALMVCLSAGLAQAEIKTVVEVDAECDVCAARHKAKVALRAFLAEKRAEKEAAQEEAEAETDE